jgi:hypothetical protein
MNHLISLTTVAALLALACGTAAAQEVNILGLPAVPQTTASGTKVPAPAGPLIRDVNGKAILSGGMQMASSYAGKLTTVRVTTLKLFTTTSDRLEALSAARLMQRDVPLSCGTLCKSGPMSEPKILPDGKVQFDLVIDGFARVVDGDDMINMVKGLPLAQRAGKPVPTASAAKPAAATSAAKGNTSTAKALTATSATAISQ